MKKAVNNQELFDAITKIHNYFGLIGQGKELVSLIVKFLNSPGVCIFYLDEIESKFRVLACQPAFKEKSLTDLVIDTDEPVIEEFFQAGKVLTRNDILTSRVISAVMSGELNNTGFGDIGLIVPLISSRHLTGIIFIDRRETDDYTWEEINLISDIALRLSPGLEKEYLRDKLTKRERELTVLNNCCGIISANFDIPVVYGYFADELKKLIDFDWTSIIIIEADRINVLAGYSDTGIDWHPGEKMPLKGSATEWVMASAMPLVEPDLRNDSLFVNDIYLLGQGLRSVVCVPLLIHGEKVIGSLIVGSRNPQAYNQKQVDFLRTLALHISMPVKNACLYAEVLKASSYDKLTGLLNRRLMDENIVIEISRHSRYGGVFTLIIFDLDSMKHINDHYGHLAGDGILARTGSLIKETIRSVDKAFRYGGDEFAILLPNTPTDMAMKVSERIRKQIAKKLIVDDMTVTASFGLASWPADGTESNELIAAADAALYKAKSKGGNQSCFSINSDKNTLK